MKINQVRNIIDLFAYCFILLLIIPACSGDKEGFRTSELGLRYKFVDASKGKTPELGDVMVMHIAYYTDKDSLLYDSKTIADSFPVVLVKPTFVGGVEEGFAMMSEGDSAIFKISADSLFEKTFFSFLPPYLSKGSSVYFRVRLNKIIPKSIGDSIASAKDIISRQEEFQKIDVYLQENNMDVMPTQNGAYLNTTKPGTGPFPVAGDTIFVAYTGRLLDGTIFDSSLDTAVPFSFVLGERKVIEGWEECFPFLNKGAVARMVIPSDLAYGGQDFGKLKGYSTLVFDVEILDIK